MAFAAIPAAAWWALGSAAAGGVAANATGHDWKKGAALGAAGGLGLSALMGAGAAGGAAAGAGSAAGTDAAILGATGGLDTAAMGAGAGAASGAGSTAGAGSFLSGAAKAGATNAAMSGAQSAMQPEIEQTSPMPFALSTQDPDSVFRIIQELQSRRMQT